MNIVLFNPQIPQNTGNVGRTCAGMGAQLHLVHPLGFKADAAAVRRAGLDYWERLSVLQWDDWSSFERQQLVQHNGQVVFFSKSAKYGSESIAHFRFAT